MVIRQCASEGRCLAEHCAGGRGLIIAHDDDDEDGQAGRKEVRAKPQCGHGQATGRGADRCRDRQRERDRGTDRQTWCQGDFLIS